MLVKSIGQLFDQLLHACKATSKCDEIVLVAVRHSDILPFIPAGTSSLTLNPPNCDGAAMESRRHEPIIILVHGQRGSRTTRFVSGTYDPLFLSLDLALISSPLQLNT